MSVMEYVKHLESKSQFSFTTQQALAEVGGSVASIRNEIRMLQQRQEIAAPLRSFHVVVRKPYRRLSCMPPDYFIGQLMKHLNEPYYVCLLSAAEIFGAAHQKPQVFQVMVKKSRPKIKCGRVCIQFIGRKDMEQMPVTQISTPSGKVRYSTPEVTAFELMGYPLKAAGINNVATVLIELADKLNSKTLSQIAETKPMSWVQRLGYMFQFLGENKLAESLIVKMEQQARGYTPLALRLSIKGSKIDSRWKVFVNCKVDPDLQFLRHKQNLDKPALKN